ncbi:MAG: hypothetical protein ACI4UT_02725 [Candidatus Enteromonas sp.]
MNKNLLLMNVLLAGAMLASCSGANGPGTPIVPSSSEEEATSESEAPIESPSSEESEKTSIDDSDFTVLNTLHVILYEKQVTNKDKVKEFQDGFAAFLAEKKVRIPTITWDYVGSDVVATLSTELEAFEAANYRGDVVLGAKAVAADKAPWFNENYECYTDNGTNVEIEFGGNTARRLWVNKNLGNPEEASYLIRYYRVLAGLPEVEETPDPIESSSEDIPDSVESSSEEPPVESSSEETVESSSEATPTPVAYPVLHVILYQKQVTDTAAVDTFKEGFATYLSDNLITIESITWDYVGTGKVATLSTELEAFEAANYVGDVVLGAKAVSATDAPWFNANYEVYNTDAGTPFEFNFGGATARRIWTNKNGQNPEARAALIAYAQTLVA